MIRLMQHLHCVTDVEIVADLEWVNPLQQQNLGLDCSCDGFKTHAQTSLYYMPFPSSHFIMHLKPSYNIIMLLKNHLKIMVISTPV